jgi:branched-chain amino acid transport system ATP-binding protein
MPDLLQVDGLASGYGEAVVLSGISFGIPDGQSLALLGRNGTGKTTLINTIVGLTTHKAGTIRLDGRDITRERPERRAHAGIGWSPQERNIFKSLTVEENLTAIARTGKWSVDRVFGMFPRLAQRRRNLGSQLSGGEQQMLAIGRALILNPRIILLDEPLEGLAPIIVDELLAALRKIIREEGISAILVEQKARKILEFTDQAIILDRGRIVFKGASAALAGDAATLETHLGVADAGGAHPGSIPLH